MLLPPFNSHSDTIIVAAPGSSFTDDQAALVRASGLFTIAIGDAGRIRLPKCDILYHCERKWWEYYNGCPEFKGLYRVSMENTIAPKVFQAPRSRVKNGFEYHYPYLATGMNSGFQAMNLAIHFKPKRLILVGYDMKKGPDGSHNVLGQHPKELDRVSRNYPLWVADLIRMLNPLSKMGISVYNCTKDTALTHFPRKDLADAIRA